LTLSTFLNILGSCIGFLSALFFAAGAIFTSPKLVFNIAKSYWDINSHWADSICDQRANYIAGALLLLLSFSSQLSANLIQPETQSLPFQPFGCAIAEIIAVLTFLLLCAVLLRNAVAKSTKETVRRMQVEALAKEELENKVHALSRKTS